MSKGFEKVNIHSCGEGIIPVPVIGENGNWYIGNDDTKVRAEGIDGKDGETGAVGPHGDKGDKGDVGPQGATGETPELAANLDTVDTGKALDATMGRVLDDKIKDVDAKLNTGNLNFDYVESDGLYYEVKVGADTVRKKLGKSGYTIPAIIIQTGSMHHATNDVTVDVTDYSTLKIIVTIFIALSDSSYIQCCGQTIRGTGTYEFNVTNHTSAGIIAFAEGANNGTIRYAVEVN